MVRPDLDKVRLGDGTSRYQGKAKNFLEAAADSNFRTSKSKSDAVPGAVVVFDSTPKNSYGHVAVVKEKLPDGSLRIQEANSSGRDPKTSLEAGGPINTRVVAVNSDEYKQIRGYVFDKPGI
jgi:surface antigen